MLLVVRCLILTSLILTHGASLIIIRTGDDTFADLWFYTLLLCLSIPLAVFSSAVYASIWFKAKLNWQTNWPDAAFSFLFIFQNLSILSQLRHWI